MRNNNKKILSIKYMVLYAFLLGLSVILGYVEVLLMPSLLVPGLKLGLPNLITVLLLFADRRKYPAFIVGFLRVILVSFLFGNLSLMLYSLPGFLISYASMVLAKKIGKMRIVFVSICGGLFHNVAQWGIACLFVKNEAIVYYLPILFLSGGIAGAANGGLGLLVYKQFSKIFSNYE